MIFWHKVNLWLSPTCTVPTSNKTGLSEKYQEVTDFLTKIPTGFIDKTQCFQWTLKPDQTSN